MVKYPVLDLVPHGSSVVALDTIESYSDHTMVASLTINEKSFLYEEFGVPTWMGVEYMGQTIAAYAGAKARTENKPVKIGFLVGTRRFESPVSHFELGSKLLISVEEIINNAQGLHVFSCKIEWNDFFIQSNLNVYMPENIEEFLERALNE